METQLVINDIQRVVWLNLSQNFILLLEGKSDYWNHSGENDGNCQNKYNDSDNDGDNVDQDSQ